jgi:signal recognition particle receptor subunit beta
MALVNHAKKEINAKIVYFGPAGSGKSSALTYIYSRIKPSLRGDLKSVPAGADNLLFFDFSPFETPLPNGYRVRLHVYTLSGIVTNPATWKMTLKGADGILFMVNPAAEHVAETKESVSQLRDFLSAYGVGLHETPAVLQFNSLTRENQPDEDKAIAAALDLSMLPTCRSNSATGEGLLEALTTLSRQVLDRVTVNNQPSEADIAPSAPSSEVETAEPARHDISSNPHDIPHTDGSPQVALLSQEVVSEGGTIRIPLEITQGDARRRLFVTVNVGLE